MSVPNAEGGGIWQANGGPAADAAGNIYVVTGNGTFDTSNTNRKNYGDSFVKISPAGTVLTSSRRTTRRTSTRNNFDLGAAGPMLLPDQPGAHPRLLVSAGKNNTIYLVDRDNMGQFNANNDNQIVQSLVNIFPFGTPEPGNYSAPVYFNGTVYFGPIRDNIQAFRLTNGLLSTTPVDRTVGCLQVSGRDARDLRQRREQWNPLGHPAQRRLRRSADLPLGGSRRVEGVRREQPRHDALQQRPGALARHVRLRDEVQRAAGRQRQGVRRIDGPPDGVSGSCHESMWRTDTVSKTWLAAAHHWRPAMVTLRRRCRRAQAATRTEQGSVRAAPARTRPPFVSIGEEMGRARRHYARVRRACRGPTDSHHRTCRSR